MYPYFACVHAILLLAINCVFYTLTILLTLPAVALQLFFYHPQMLYYLITTQCSKVFPLSLPLRYVVFSS